MSSSLLELGRDRHHEDQSNNSSELQPNQNMEKPLSDLSRQCLHEYLSEGTCFYLSGVWSGSKGDLIHEKQKDSRMKIKENLLKCIHRDDSLTSSDESFSIKSNVSFHPFTRINFM